MGDSISRGERVSHQGHSRGAQPPGVTKGGGGDLVM